MEREYVESVVTTLLSLAAQDQWEVRHASLMGMQHLLAARTVSGGPHPLSLSLSLSLSRDSLVNVTRIPITGIFTFIVTIGSLRCFSSSSLFGHFARSTGR